MNRRLLEVMPPVTLLPVRASPALEQDAGRLTLDLAAALRKRGVRAVKPGADPLPRFECVLEEDAGRRRLHASLYDTAGGRPVWQHTFTPFTEDDVSGAMARALRDLTRRDR